MSISILPVGNSRFSVPFSLSTTIPEIVITDSGVLMRQPISAIRTIGRVTQGVRLVKLDAGTNISSITRVISEDAATKEKKEESDQLSIETEEEKPKSE